MGETIQGIFRGLRILDLTKVYSGPLATRYLADYGAEVWKIESPAQPDPTRNFPPLVNGSSGYYEILNRNKKSLILDLKSASDLKLFYKLVKTADIIVENMSPSSKHKLKIDYETVKKYNKKIIYASLAGKDQDTDEKYFDIIAQAESGLMSLTGTPECPVKIGPAAVDAFAGANLAFAIAGALYHRERTGRGQFLSVSMLGCAINMQEQNLVEYSVTGRNPVRPGNQDNAIAPFGVYKTGDSFIALALGSDPLWEDFVSVFGGPLTSTEFSSNELRLKNQISLTKAIENVFRGYSSKDLEIKLKEHNLPCAKIAEMSDVASNKWFFEHGALTRFNHPALGDIIVPGRCVEFAAQPPFVHTESPRLKLSTAKYVYRPLIGGDLKSLTLLLDTCFDISCSPKSKPVAWKYYDYPFLPPVTCAAFDGSKMVSFYSNVNIPVSRGIRDYTTYASLDMSTDPGHRGRGLISVLSKKVYQQIDASPADFSFGFSNDQGVKVDKNAGSYGYYVLGEFGKYAALARPVVTGCQVSVAGSLTASDSSSPYFHLSYSQPFLNWRYRDKPGSSYTYLTIEKEGRLMAQAIVLEKPFRLNVYKIIPHENFDLEAVLAAIINYAFRHAKQAVSLYPLINGIWSPVLKRLGFRHLRSRNQYYLTVRPSRGKAMPEGLLDCENWFLMGGDIL